MYDDLCRQREGKQQGSDEDEDETKIIRGKRYEVPAKRVRIAEGGGDEEDEIDRMERERLEDIKDRDEFAKRLKVKDESKTRSIVSKSGNE
jgi:pre-mRNA-splicing factor ATP-dependent RNA helicase DHX16